MKFIRKIIRETIGVVLPIDKLSEELAVNFFNYLENLHNKNDALPTNFKIDYETLDHYLTFVVEHSTLPIYKIIIPYQIDKNKKENQISGTFMSEKTREVNDGYEVYIKFVLPTMYNNDIAANFSSVFSHELHHFYDLYKRKGKESKTKGLNSVKNIVNINKDFIKKYPILKHFMNAFYFSLPEEMNARVQQVYNEMKQYSELDYNSLVSKFRDTGVFKDIQELRSFDYQNLINIPAEEQNKFIEIFNNTVKNLKIDLNYPKDTPEKFFKYWNEKFESNGNKLFYKCLKTIGSLKNIQEESIAGFYKHMKPETFNYLLESINEVL